MRMLRGLAVVLGGVAAAGLAGCGAGDGGAGPVTVAPAKVGSGAVHGGQQPVAGATIQLYAVGTTGNGSSATPLLTRAVVTDGAGGFDITGAYACPASGTLVYIVATGGSPGGGVVNAQLSLMSAIGACGTLGPSTFLSINELTTVAAVNALAGYVQGYAAVGSGASDAGRLAEAFTTAGWLVNVGTGQTPGTGAPAGVVIPVTQLNTLADLAAACVNTGGGVAGDGSVCGSLFALTKPPSGAAATDVVGAMADLAVMPGQNVGALFGLIPAAGPFEPADAVAPADWAVRLGVPSAFTVTPGELMFAAATVGFTSAAQTVTVTNGTAGTVYLATPSITGTNAGDFAIAGGGTNDCTGAVSAGASCTVEVAFTPSAAGARAAYLVVGNTSANESLAVMLTGTGAAPAAGPAVLSPSSVTLTQYGVPQTVTLTNNGSGVLSINSITLSSTGFTETNNCGTSLGAGTSCAIQVEAPTTVTGTATLTVLDDAAAGPQTATVDASGLAQVTFPPVVDFGHWAQGATGFQSFEIVGPNISGSFSLSLSGANAGDFSFGGSNGSSTTCNYEYRNGVNCNISIGYTPSATTATSTAQVTIAGVGQFTVMGESDSPGVDFDYFAAQAASGTYYRAPIHGLTLGSSVVGTGTSASFFIYNTGTVMPLALQTAMITGPNASEFTVTAPDCSNGCIPTVTFTPAGTGLRTATLTYTDSTGARMRSLPLSGTGKLAGAPAPTISPTDTLVFSNTPIGTTSAAQTITVTAYGGDPVQGTIVATETGFPAPFKFVGPSYCAATPCTLQVAYDPMSSADDLATVYVIATDTVTGGQGSTQAYGQVAPLISISLNPTSLTFASQASGTTSAAQTVTVTNNGSEVATLSFSVLSTGGSAVFPYTSHCGATLAVGASCTVDVQFAPDSTGSTFTGDLEVDSGGTPEYVDLSGTSP